MKASLTTTYTVCVMGLITVYCILCFKKFSSSARKIAYSLFCFRAVEGAELPEGKMERSPGAIEHDQLV